MTQWGLDNLFNPGKRHMDDEKRRLQSTREEIGDNSRGRRIDLEGGKVSISVPRPVAPSADVVDDDQVTEVPLEAALEAEDVPAVALGSDEAEIEPALIPSEPVAEPADAPVAESAPVLAAEPSPDAAPEPPAPKRRLSANAWSRRG